MCYKLVIEKYIIISVLPSFLISPEIDIEPRSLIVKWQEWKPDKDDGDGPLFGYRVQWRKVDDDDQTILVSWNTSSLMRPKSDLQNISVDYRYRIQGISSIMSVICKCTSICIKVDIFLNLFQSKTCTVAYF